MFYEVYQCTATADTVGSFISLSALPSSGTYPYFFLQPMFKQHFLAWTGEADAVFHGSVACSVQYNAISVSQTPSSAYPL